MLAPPRSDGTAQHNAFLGWVTSSRVCRPKPPPSARCVMAQPAQVFRELLRENGRAHCVLDHSCDATPTRRSARAGRCAIPRSSSLMRRAGIEPPITPRQGSFVNARPAEATATRPPWHDEGVHHWPGRAHVETLRLWPELARTVQRVESLPDCYGALLLIGSLSRGEGDAISDVDLIAVAHEGGWQAAWDVRHRLSEGALVTFDRFGDRRAVAGHNWITPALVKVECLIAEPIAGGVRLFGEAAVLLGCADVLDKFERRPALTRQQINDYVAELREEQRLPEIEDAYGDLMTLLQREIRPTID
jgi:hypothetical protein